MALENSLMKQPGHAMLLLGLLVACGDTPTATRHFVVAYSLTGSTGISFDSVKYEDSTGTLIKVAAPPLNWAIASPASSGSYVQATAWAFASGAGETARLRVMWTESGVSSTSDSSKAVTAAPGRFTLSIARRQI
jgi:hypothetical protein